MQGFYPTQISKVFQGIIPYSYGTQDPSVTATAGAQGQLYLQMPSGILFKKNDNGKTTNWTIFDTTPKITNVYYVGDSAPFTTIQSAVDQAVADGHTDNNNPAVIVVAPKIPYYNEVVNVYPGIHVQGISVTYGNAVNIIGGFRYAGTYSGNNTVDTASVSYMSIIDNLSDYCIDYQTTTSTNFILNYISVQKSNSDQDTLYMNSQGGNLFTTNINFDSNRNNIQINIDDGSWQNPFSFSGLNGGIKAVRKNGSGEALMLGININCNGCPDAAIDLLQGQLIFSLGGISNGNPSPATSGIYIANGAMCVFQYGSLIIPDNGANKAISGDAGGLLIYSIMNFLDANDKVEAALTSILVNSTPVFV